MLGRANFRIDPFPLHNDGFSFSTPALNQRIDLVHQLIQLSQHPVIMVVGVHGSGKTTALHTLLRDGDPSWRVCWPKTGPATGRDAFVDALIDGWGLDRRGEYGLELLDHHVSAIDQSAATSVIVVDDAHELPAQTRRGLEELVERWRQFRVRWILTGERERMVFRLRSPAGGEGTAGVAYHEVDIPPLEEAEVAIYLNARLAYYGLHDVDCSSTMVRSIHRGSKGIPATVHVLARQALNSPAPHRASAHLGYGGLVVLVAASVAAGAWWHLRSPGLIGEVGIGSIGAELPTPGTPPVESERPAERSVSQRSGQSTAGTADVESLAVTERWIPNANALGPDNRSSASEITTTTTASPARSTPQAPQPYVLQLMAGRDSANMLRFARAQGLAARARQIVGERNGEPWYILVYGSYDSAQSARAAIRRLPPAVRQLAPWPRRRTALAQAGRFRDIAPR